VTTEERLRTHPKWTHGDVDLSAPLTIGLLIHTIIEDFSGEIRIAREYGENDLEIDLGAEEQPLYSVCISTRYTNLGELLADALLYLWDNDAR
jgi:hypothetical protein